ncbi:hypothetical protein H8K33_13375 [Undibacterium amnicola]|uniref:Uncharacterized protein n=1 Tax=Undibacterium amnicola TaxID=1834038 RepID=A0ABR6XU84_9BURK|nr:hypothetical protein [Undibacterium amnicola]MBC3832492.1 hypothetical protein [Undibacterium amnicola]
MNYPSKKSIVIIAVFLLILILPFVVIHIKFVYPVDSFCRNIENDETREQIILAGKAKGFFIWKWQEDEMVWIVNHNEGPLFRVACSVRFKDGKPIQKGTVFAD